MFQTDFSDVVLHLPFNINLGIGAFISAVINFIIHGIRSVLYAESHEPAAWTWASMKKKSPPSRKTPKAPTQEELLTEILAVLKEQQAANGK